MSKDIDHKVVSMEFDNSKFDKNAEQSIGVIDRLKEALNFEGAERGFATLQNAIHKVTFSPLTDGIDTVYAKFTMMERFVIQLYDRMANKMIDIGSRITREAFVTPIRSGTSEYELKMESVQRIMNSSNESLDTVNKKLAELNKYADDTIYSFADMTNNIGKFTNAGVPLEQAVAAIKGISNEAALAGANANEASRAMYNFAQALSSGTVKYIDWKSIENANMATKEFKEQLIETAVSLKTLTKLEDNTYKTLEGNVLTATSKFNDSLKDQWLTSDVLIQTLARYSDELDPIGKKANDAAKRVKTLSMLLDTLKEALQSGWAESWEYIVGNFDKASALWTGISNELGGIIDRMNTARNTMLKFWSELGGRESMINAFANVWYALKETLGAIRDGFRSVFPAVTGKRLVDFTRAFENLTRKMKPSLETLDNIKRTFRGFFSVLGLAADIVKAFGKVILPIFGDAFSFGASNLLEFTGNLGDWIYNLRKAIQEGKVFEKAFEKIGKVIKVVVNAFKSLILYFKSVVKAFKEGGLVGALEAIGRGFKNIVKSMWDYVKKLDPVGAVKKLGVKMADAVSHWPIGKAIVDFLKKVKNTIADSSVWKFCVGVVEGFVSTIQAAINKFRGINTDGIDDFTDKVGTKFKVLEGIKKFFIAIWHGIVAVWETISPTLRNLGSQVLSVLDAIFADIRGMIQRSNLSDAGIFAAGGGIAAVMLAIAHFVKELSGTTRGIKKIADNINGLLKAITGTFQAFTGAIHAATLKSIAVSIAILAGSLFLLAAIPTDAVIKATSAILLLFQSLIATMDSYKGIAGFGGKDFAGSIMSLGAQMLMIAVAVGILVANLGILALIPYESMIKGLAVLALMLRMLGKEVESFKMGKDQQVMKMAGNLMAMAFAINIIATALGKIALAAWLSRDYGIGIQNPLIAAVTSVIVMMSFIVYALKTLNGVKVDLTGSVGFLAGLAIIIIILTNQLIKIAVAFAGLTAISDTFNPADAGDAILTITTILGAVGAFIILAMKLGDIAASKAGVTKDTRSGPGSIVALSGVILAIGLAMVAIAGAFGIMALIPSDKLDKVAPIMYSVLAIVGAIIILSSGLSIFAKETKQKTKKVQVSIKLMASTALSMWALAGAVIAISAAAVIMSKADTAAIISAATVLAVIGVLFIAMSSVATNDGVAKGMERVTKAMIGIATATAIFSAALLLGVIALKQFRDLTGDEIDQIMENLDDFAMGLHEHGYSIAKAAGSIIGMILVAAIQTFTGSFFAVVVELGETIVQALDVLLKFAPEIIDRVLQIAIKIIDGVTARADELIESAVNMIIKVVNALASAIEKHGDEILNALDRLLDAAITLVLKALGRLRGLTGEELDNWVNEWKGVGRVISIITLAFAGLNKAFGVITKVTGAVKGLGTIISVTAGAAKEAGSLSLALNNGLLDGLLSEHQGLLKVLKGITKLGAAIPGPMKAVAALTLAISGAFKIATRQIDVVGEATRKEAQQLEKLKDIQEEYNSALAKRTDVAKGINREYAGTQRQLDELRKIVDANGRIKSGYEEQAQTIIEDVNRALGETLEIEDGYLKTKDKEGQLRTIEIAQLDEILKKKRQQDKLDRMYDDVEKEREKLTSGEYQIAIADAMKAESEAGAEQLEQIKDREDKIREMEKYLLQPKAYTGELRSQFDRMGKTGVASEIQRYKDEIKDLTSAMEMQQIIAHKSTIEMIRQKDAAQSMVDSYDKLQKAIIEGDDAAAAEAETALTQGLFLSSTDIRVLSDQFYDFIKARNRILEMSTKENPLSTEGLDEGIKQLRDYIVSIRPDLKSWADDLVSAVPEAITEVAKTDAVEAGESLMDGVNLGVQSGTLEAVESAKQLANNFMTAFRKELGIASPSKVMARLGYFAAMGVPEGVKDGTPEAEQAFTNLAKTTIAAYSAAVDENAYVPALVPTVDTSMIQNGSRSLQRQFNALTNGALSGTMTSRLAASVDPSSFNVSQDRVIRSMSELQGQVRELQSAMLSMQVVMDNGVLVGQLAPGMDRELGKRTTRKGRGV